MKKVSVLAIFFALTVLAGVVFAAGGDSSDPLISLSYLQGTFRDKVDRSVDSKLDTSDKAAYAQAESALHAAISAAEANVGGNVADTFTEGGSSRAIFSPAQRDFRSSCSRVM